MHESYQKIGRRWDGIGAVIGPPLGRHWAGIVAPKLLSAPSTIAVLEVWGTMTLFHGGACLQRPL